MLGLAACGPLGARPLSPEAQAAAAEKLARGFADVCLTAADAAAATRALQAQGWPMFGTVWSGPQSVFFAAKPSAASPAGLFVIGAPRWNGTPAYQLTCVGHYPAESSDAARQAMERRWGPSQPGSQTYPGSRSWSFRLRPGATDLEPAAGGLPQTPAIAALAPGEALIYGQVYYNGPLHDVASLVAVYRRPR